MRVPRGPGYGRTLVGLLASLALDRLPLRAQRVVQRRRLRRLLAATGSGDRMPRGTDPFAALQHEPIVDRTDVQARGRSFLTVDPADDDVSVSATSGSSGVPVRIYADRADRARMRATYLADLVSLGLRPTDRVAYVRSSAFAASPTARVGVLRAAHIDSRLPLAAQADAMIAARPTFVVGFPNVILSIVEELDRRHETGATVRRVVFGGERVTDGTRRRVASFFDATTAEVYACVEAGTIARSCTHGRMHLRVTDVVVEVETPTGTRVEEGTGDLVVTVLRRHAMRFVRYRLGDGVRIVPSTCACGRRTPVVDDVMGRTEDRIVDADGVRVHADFLTDFAERHPQVRRQQVVQHRPGEAEIHVELHDDADPDVVDRLRAELRRDVPGFTIDVRRVERCTVSAGGKLQLVRSLVEDPGS